MVRARNWTITKEAHNGALWRDIYVQVVLIKSCGAAWYNKTIVLHTGDPNNTEVGSTACFKTFVMFKYVERRDNFLKLSFQGIPGDFSKLHLSTSR